MEPVEQYAVITKTELGSLNDAIKRLADQLTAQNNRAKEIEEVFSCKFDQIAKDHEKLVDLRIERLNQQYGKMQDFVNEHEKLFIKECALLQQMQTYSLQNDNTLAQAQNIYHKADNELTESKAEKKKLAERLDDFNYRLVERDTEIEKLCDEPDEADNILAKSVTEKSDLAKKTNEADDKLAESDPKKKNLAERHSDAYNKMDKSNAEKKDLVERFNDAKNTQHGSDAVNNHMRPDNDNCRLELVALETDNSLAQLQSMFDEAKKQLAKSDAKNRRLCTELENCRLELQNSRELASITKLRQLKELKELDMTEEISAVISRLKEDKATLVGHVMKQNTVCRDAGDAEETDDGNKLDDTGFSLPDYLQQIKKVYTLLLEQLEPKKVAAFMFTNDALTVKELQSIQHSHKTHYEASEELLKIVLEVKEQHVYNCFLKAMRDTNQQHIWSLLSYDDYDIDCEHVKLIQQHYSFIVDSMDARDSGLLAELYARGVIDERDKDDIEAETCSIPRNEKLLSYLGRKSQEKFILFLEAMSHTGQEYIVSELRGNEDSYHASHDDRTAASEAGHSVNTESPANIDDTTAEIIPESPTLKQVIPSDGRRVDGLAFINNELFVLRYPSKEEIQVYETATFTKQRTVRVAGLSDGWSVCKSLTSCDVNNWLFVCDRCKVYKIDISTDNLINWKVDGRPCGLSVNEETRHVIVTCRNNDKIREYKPTGQLIRTIKLLESHVTEPCHAVQLKDGKFIVSHQKPVNGISLIDRRGRVITTYKNSDSMKLLTFPRQFIVVKNGSVLVVDSHHKRLVVLHASLKSARKLTLPIDGGLNGPQCIHFNESLSQLYVGEFNGQRVVICDNVSLE